MKGFWTLAAGVGALAIVLGFMIAASGTPVGSIAIPAAFGIAVTALGLFQTPPIPSKPIGKEAKDEQPPASAANRLTRLAPNRLGAALLCFSVGFAGGIVLGAKARLAGWFAPTLVALEPTWLQHSLPSPPTAEAAVYWLYVQSVLQDRGVQGHHIKALYELQSRDWTIRIPRSSSPQAPLPAASSVGPGAGAGKIGVTIDDLFRTPTTANPIANNPTPARDPSKLPS